MPTVTFKRTAFIDGTRYRPGQQDYSGDIDKLPADALVNGKPIEGRTLKEEPKMKNADFAAERKNIEDEVRNDPKLREQLKAEAVEELKKDEAFRKEIADSLPKEKSEDSDEEKAKKGALDLSDFGKKK